MASRRLNALRLLPEELFLAVSKALGGQSADLYIPSIRSLRRERRNELIVEMADDGHTTEDIANEFFVSPATVWRVLAKSRAASAPSDSPAGQARPNPQVE